MFSKYCKTSVLIFWQKSEWNWIIKTIFIKENISCFCCVNDLFGPKQGSRSTSLKSAKCKQHLSFSCYPESQSRSNKTQGVASNNCKWLTLAFKNIQRLPFSILSILIIYNEIESLKCA
jgi:hypothetical protein